MKHKLTLLTLCLCIALSCKNNTDKQSEKSDTATENQEQTASEEVVAESEDNTVRPAIIDSTYIIRNENNDKGWTEVKVSPSDNALKGNIYPKSHTLYITEDLGDWLQIWGLITYDENGKYTSNAKEGYLYIRKDLTGSFRELHVNESDLYVYSDWVDGSNKEIRVSDDTLSFKLINKELFYEKKKTSSDHILYDTLNIVKKNGVISLPCKEKTVKLEDIDTDGDNMAMYKYLGQMPDFNAYLIYGLYFESFNYFLIDKTTGENIGSFGDFPALSPDKKLIVSIWGNIYDDVSEVGIYKTEKEDTSENDTDSEETGKFPIVCSYIFTKWLPLHVAYGYETDYFWGNDGYLYVRIQTAELSGQTLKEESRQYMRVKILNAARI